MLIFVAVLLHNLIGFSVDMPWVNSMAFLKNDFGHYHGKLGTQNARLEAVLALKHFTPQNAIPNAFLPLCV